MEKTDTNHLIDFHILEFSNKIEKKSTKLISSKFLAVKKGFLLQNQSFEYDF
jgi:hypothetical protein